MAEASMDIELLPVIGNNTGRLLPTMLQGVQTQRGMRRRLIMGVNAKNAAFFTKLVKHQYNCLALGNDKNFAT
jgi:hypothetical protein